MPIPRYDGGFVSLVCMPTLDADPTGECAPGQLRCWDGTCVASLVLCTADGVRCPANAPIKCGTTHTCVC